MFVSNISIVIIDFSPIMKTTVLNFLPYFKCYSLVLGFTSNIYKLCARFM